MLVDFDPQANLTVASGVNPLELEGRSVYEMLKENAKARDIIVTTDFGFDLLPSSIALARTESELASSINRERKLATKLREMEREGQNYDFVLIDCAPSLGILTVMALTASDYVIIPLKADEFSLQGLGDFLDIVSTIQQETNVSTKKVGVNLSKKTTLN